MGTIKERSGKDLIEAKVINRWQDTQNYSKKTDLDDPDNHNGVATHLELDILECKVTWALGSITMNKTS